MKNIKLKNKLQVPLLVRSANCLINPLADTTLPLQHGITTTLQSMPGEVQALIDENKLEVTILQDGQPDQVISGVVTEVNNQTLTHHIVCVPFYLDRNIPAWADSFLKNPGTRKPTSRIPWILERDYTVVGATVSVDKADSDQDYMLALYKSRAWQADILLIERSNKTAHSHLPGVIQLSPGEEYCLGMYQQTDKSQKSAFKKAEVTLTLEAV